MSTHFHAGDSSVEEDLIFLCESSLELVLLAFRYNKYSIEKKHGEK